MNLKQELLELEKEIMSQTNGMRDKAILLHAKAHMFHNKRLHKKAVIELSKLDIEHKEFDNLDKTYKQ